ncbi:MAG: hypothetical protein HS111_05315 [Kofleriaceae bacterium]|nr:hypothetical protein [Kofleriaceae bacterium]
MGRSICPRHLVAPVLAGASVAAIALIALGACRARDGASPPGGAGLAHRGAAPVAPPEEAALPRAPGRFAPSLMAIAGGGEVDGNTLGDIDTCATCHPDVTTQWQSGIHSFASFGNPIYRTNVELARRLLGKAASQHCGGCHDAPLEVDGAMLAEVAADDLRAHTGVSCRVCHGVRSTTTDGNGSYVLAAGDLPTPDVDDPASVEEHRQAVSVKALGDELCVACHRGFLSPDLDVPVHLSGIDEPTFWRSSAWTGNGTGRVDQVEPRGCIDCHMPEVAAPGEEYSADKVVRGHHFPGGHTWMAAMRADAGQLARIRELLVGSASIDVAGAIVPRDVGGNGPHTLGGQWHLPADGAPVVPGQRLLLDVVVRNRLVGHRFPGGVADMQDTWIEASRHRGPRRSRRRLLASSGLAHERDPQDHEAHVLRSYPVDDHGRELEEHELPHFRAVASNHDRRPRQPHRALRPRRAAGRAAAARGAGAAAPPQPQPDRPGRGVHGRRASRRAKAFLRQARGLREMHVDPCAPQPVTEIARTTAWLGTGWQAAAAKAGAAARAASAAPEAAWERTYEHGMGLIGVISERLDEPRQVLEHALGQLAETPETARARAMLLVQLGSVLGKQGRTDEALAALERARALLPPPGPPVIDTLAADALARVWRWKEAEVHAARATEKAPRNTGAWVMLARVRGSLHDDAGALAAAREGLRWSPRDPDLLRSQATAVAGLVGASDPLARAALAAFDRFRAPDQAAALRIACANASARCAGRAGDGARARVTRAR